MMIHGFLQQETKYDKIIIFLLLNALVHNK